MHENFFLDTEPVQTPLSCEELLVRAQALTGRTVGELARAVGVKLPTHEKNAKGFVGQLIERALGADPQAGDQPDFPQLGVELKTIPIQGNGIPKESTFCCAITMAEAASETWQTSRLKRKLSHVLWMPYQSQTQSLDTLFHNRRFFKPRLWRPSIHEWQQLQQDFEHLIGKIGAGESAQVTGYEGLVLQVRPKGRDSFARTWGPELDDGPERVLPLGFYLRPTFTALVLASSDLSVPIKPASHAY